MRGHQWFRNGDHPDDGDSSREGLIVRYFRDPDVPDNLQCPHCDETMYYHGWIPHISEYGHVVCPGDYIVELGGQHYPIKTGLFAELVEADERE